MTLKVHKVEITRERKRFDGSVILQASCVVGDASGCAVLNARNEQLDFVKEGQVITIRNAYSRVHEDEKMRLEVDKWGKVESSSENITEVNLDNNQSEVEFELVPVKKNQR